MTNNYEFKIVPLDRRTGAPACDPEGAPVCMIVDVDALYEVTARANPNAGPLPAHLDRQAFVVSVAKSICAMFSADVYYRPQGGEAWRSREGRPPGKVRRGRAEAV
jgi:hypothetical protein